MLKLFRLMTLTLVLCSLLAFALPITIAQESEATEEVVAANDEAAITSEGAIAEPSANVPGVSAAMLFLGAGAIVVVGLLMIARDNFSGENETP